MDTGGLVCVHVSMEMISKQLHSSRDQQTVSEVEECDVGTHKNIVSCFRITAYLKSQRLSASGGVQDDEYNLRVKVSHS